MANENADGNFSKCDDLNIIPFSLERQDIRKESLMAGENGDNVYPHEFAIHNNTLNLIIDISSIPCGISSRIPKCEDV